MKIGAGVAKASLCSAVANLLTKMRGLRFTGHAVSVGSLVQPRRGAYSLSLTVLQHLLIFGTSDRDSSLRAPIRVELFGARSGSMTTCHGLRLVLLEQESKDDKSEKAFRSAVHAKFPYIKADDLPKGKYALRDTAERLVARFPTELLGGEGGLQGEGKGETV